MNIPWFYRKEVTPEKGRSPYDYTTEELMAEHGSATNVIAHYAKHPEYDLKGHSCPMAYFLWMERLEQIRKENQDFLLEKAKDDMVNEGGIAK